MMDYAELLGIIRTEVAKQVRVILSGAADTNDQFSEDIAALYPGMDKISSRPVMHPYGFASRAPAGTIQVTARQGDHPGNRVVLGHRAADRPAMQQGETVLYNAFGQQIRVQNGKILLGNGNASQPFVLGTALKSLLDNLLSALNSHTHSGVITGGGVSGPPSSAFSGDTAGTLSAVVLGE